ncbi:glutathionylspermidine synthase family protein [Alteromonas sp. AMM-1]|uniref:glutathionylspermidine synthase family protein n=1 Tax=Alteromonas sp. AMM-1 TaxID=3394233 RepID=UPI0039A5BF33
MTAKHTNTDLPFGMVQGIAPGNVPAYCSDYDTVDETQHPNRQSFKHYHNGIYTGYKWQCVEFARRWLLINTGCVFDDVAMAYDIFTLRTLTHVQKKASLPLQAFRNGSKQKPQAGCLLIWEEGGEFAVTGHVAIIVRVNDDCVHVAEQNASYQAWPEGADYARSLPMYTDESGGVWIKEPEHGTAVLGWMIQTQDSEFAEPSVPFIPSRMQVLAHRIKKAFSANHWLNEANLAEKAYVDMMEGHAMVAQSDPNQFYSVSDTARKAVKRATTELHRQFMHAIDYVLQNPTCWPAFNIPDVIWPKIQQSWNNRRNEVMTGRFDFCLSERGLKLYEYNADSASCYMEAGRIQGKWARVAGVEMGADSGQDLFGSLVTAWTELVEEVTENGEPLHIHVLYDSDLEEAYHARYMCEAMEAAGIVTHLQQGFKGLHFNDAGQVVDANDRPITRVWKTWAWETALDQLRADLNDTSAPASGQPRLSDILLQDNVMVHEPLWTLLPSNKAMLTVLWELFPDSPYLLESTFEITDSLSASGYVSKPIAGRCGANITMVDASDQKLSESLGKFSAQDRIYQALFPLPFVGEQYVQICSFCVTGAMRGMCTRVDTSAIITSKSDVVPLRVIPDNEHDQCVINLIK